MTGARAWASATAVLVIFLTFTTLLSLVFPPAWIFLIVIGLIALINKSK